MLWYIFLIRPIDQSRVQKLIIMKQIHKFNATWHKIKGMKLNSRISTIHPDIYANITSKEGDLLKKDDIASAFSFSFSYSFIFFFFHGDTIWFWHRRGHASHPVNASLTGFFTFLTNLKLLIQKAKMKPKNH